MAVINLLLRLTDSSGLKCETLVGRQKRLSLEKYANLSWLVDSFGDEGRQDSTLRYSSTYHLKAAEVWTLKCEAWKYKCRKEYTFIVALAAYLSPTFPSFSPTIHLFLYTVLLIHFPLVLFCDQENSSLNTLSEAHLECRQTAEKRQT